MSEARKLTKSDSGRLGGEACKERYGREQYQAMGRRGGRTTASLYGPEYYREIGQAGGRATSQKYDTAHYRALSQKGAARLRELLARGKAAEEGER